MTVAPWYDENELAVRTQQGRQGSHVHSIRRKVDWARNGVEAVSAVASRRYDVVLMDCQMPEMDGFAATAAIRKAEQESGFTARVRIVALTANAVQGDRDRCLAAGMDDYLAKPFRKEQLARVLVTHGANAAVIASA